MSTRFSKSYLLVPVVYVGVIFGLLFLQFSGGERLTRSIGPLWLRATRDVTSDSGEPTVRGLSVEFNGLLFDFGDDGGVIVETADDITEVPVRGFVQTEDGFRVDFDNDFVVRFAASEDPVTELQVRLEIPESAGSVREVALPFRFTGATVPETVGRASFITVSSEGRQYYLTAPPDALIDSANGKIILQPQASNRAIRYVEASTGNPQAVLSWFANGAHDVTPAEYESAVGRFVDAAYAGWLRGRYNSSTLSWEGRGGTAEFTEQALTAFLAEAWRRDEYDRAYAEMRRATDLHPRELGLLSSAFLGNLREVRARFLERDAATAAEIQAEVASGSPTVFRRPDLYLFAADRAGGTIYEDLLRFTEVVDLRAVDVTTAVGMLGNYLLSEHPEGRSRSAGARFAQLVNTHILGSIVRAGDLFFLQSAPGQIDVRLSAVAGVALAAVGDETSDGTLTAVGRNLVLSVLSLADRYGMLPASLVVRGESIEQDDGTIPPETIYRYVANNPWYPHQVSLYDKAGPGAWVWTAADVTPVTLTATEWRFRLEYPRLRTHYLILQGVPDFARLELFGQTWRNAPDFEIYSKGRHYNEQTETLMIKYYDDSVRRDVAIFFP